MRRPTVVALLAATLLMAVWSFATWAQVGDPDACRSACHEQSSICVGECGTDPDPVECEGRCQDQLEDCLEECD